MERFGFSSLLAAGRCESDEGDMSYLLQEGDAVCWIPEMSRSVNPIRNLAALIRIWSVLRTERPLIVHTHTAMAGCLGRIAAKAAGVPIIVHTFHGNSLQQYFSPLMNRFFLNVERLLAKFTDAICVICKQQLCELSDDLSVAPRQKFRVVPLGLELDTFLSLPYPTLMARKLKVLWLGRLVPVKGIDLLSKVIRTAVTRDIKIEFVVAGDGSEAHTIKSLASEFPGHVRWLGWQKDIVRLVESSDVLLQTSRNEGTPVSLIQGMAGARPFVSTAVGGIKDMVVSPVVQELRGCSWYANAVLTPNDPASMVEALEELANNPSLLRSMGTCSRQFANSIYRKELLLSNLNALYHELIERKTHGVTRDLDSSTTRA
jgi:glycosyltransferase involved in cell wall biosynthesis